MKKNLSQRIREIRELKEARKYKITINYKTGQVTKTLKTPEDIEAELRPRVPAILSGLHEILMNNERNKDNWQ